MPLDINTINSQGENQNTLQNHSGIAFDQLKAATITPNVREVDGYRERFVNDGSQATRVFDVPWTARRGFVQWALGVSKNNNGTLTRTIPAQHPEWPWLYAQECDLLQGLGFIYNNPLVLPVDQFGDPVGQIPVPMIGYFDSSTAQESNVLTDGFARYAVTYRALDFTVYSDLDLQIAGLTELHRWVSRDTTYAVQALKIPNWILVYKDNPDEVIPEGGFLLQGVQEVIYRWHEVPDPPETGIEDCLGKVNDAVFDPPVTYQGTPINGTPPNGYPAGTLLMMTGPEKKRYRTKAGRVCWDITYRFLYRKVGHNFFPDTSGTYREAQHKNSGKPVFDKEDFMKLFSQPVVPFKWQGQGG